MSQGIIYIEGYNPNGGNENTTTLTTSLGIEFIPSEGSQTLQIGNIGTNGVLSDGSHLISGVYNGQGENELDPLSWDNIITN